MNQILIVSEQKNAAALSDAIFRVTDCVSEVVSSMQEARNTKTLAQFDCILISTPTQDEETLCFARHCAKTTRAGILLLVKEDLTDEQKKSIANLGIFVTKQSIHTTSLCKIIKLLASQSCQPEGIRGSYEALQKKIDEMRMIDRAKNVLMERLLFSEEQAYHYITKHAMDMRVTKEKVAQAVLYTYGGTDPLKKEP